MSKVDHLVEVICEQVRGTKDLDLLDFIYKLLASEGSN